MVLRLRISCAMRDTSYLTPTTDATIRRRNVCDLNEISFYKDWVRFSNASRAPSLKTAARTRPIYANETQLVPVIHIKCIRVSYERIMYICSIIYKYIIYVYAYYVGRKKQKTKKKNGKK